MIDNAVKIDLTVTKGVVRGCILDELNYFNTNDNMVPDIMHDVEECAIPMTMHGVFKYMIANKIYS